MAALSDASDTTFKTVFVTTGGGQIRFYVAHGRFYVTTQSPDGRRQNTTPATVEQMRFLATRLNELAVIAEAQTQKVA